MTASIQEHLPPVPYARRALTTAVQPGASARPLESQVMPYRKQPSPPNRPENRPPRSEAGKTYTIHKDMSGLKSDILGHIIDLYA